MSCTSLRTPRSQLLLGLPGFLLQSGTDVVPASSSTDSCRASCAGAPSGKRLTCLKRASLQDPGPVTDECTYIRQTCLFSNWWVYHEIWPPDRPTKNVCQQIWKSVDVIMTFVTCFRWHFSDFVDLFSMIQWKLLSLQHYDSFQVRIHQLTPDLTDVGTSLDEAKILRQEHQELTAKLHVSTALWPALENGFEKNLGF